MKKRTRKPQLPAKLQARLESFDGVNYLELSGLANEIIPTSDVDALLVHADIDDLFVQGFKGTLKVGYDEQLVTCRRLRLQDCRIKTMTASRAAFEECEFIDCDFDQLRALGTAFVRCTFNGSIRSGIFECKDISDPGSKALPFENNDFRQCSLRDTTFRGGIDLRKQIFSEEQAHLIVPDGAQILAQLDAFIAKGRAGAGFNSLRDRLHRAVVNFKQEQVFVSQDGLQKFCADTRDFRDRYAAVSPEFFRWISAAEGLCEKPAVNARSRKG